MKKSACENFKKYRTAAGILLVGIALYQLAGIGMEYRKGTEFYSDIEHAVTAVASSGKEDTETDDAKEDAKKEPSEERASEDTANYRDFMVDFEALKRINADIVGWIRFDKNGINYQLLQGEDNEEYLYRMADRTENKAGSIFLDCLCAPDFSDLHTIIYGHNMRDLSMFGELKKYGTNQDYFQENSCFTIYTQENIFRYAVFAWYEANADDTVYQVGFTEDAVYQEFVETMLRRRYKDTEITAGRTDRIVTLSTCTSVGRRFVVHGKLLEQLSWE